MSCTTVFFITIYRVYAENNIDLGLKFSSFFDSFYLSARAQVYINVVFYIFQL